MSRRLEPGSLLGAFLIERLLGEGAWGQVWAAVNRETGESIALKVLRPELAFEGRTRLRFLREGMVGKKVQHPGLAAVRDVGIDDDIVYIAFERLQGACLDTVLRAPERMPTVVFVDLMRQAAAVLAALHRVGVIHRDLKPANLFVHRADGSADLALKVLDFGVSKVLLGTDGVHTQTSSFLGTPRYVSPEHVVSAGSVDSRTDLWSLGVILFEGLSGTFPHHGRDVMDLLRSISRDPPASLDVLRPALPAGLRAVVRDCLRPRVSRIVRAAEVAERLADVLYAGVDPTERLPTHTEWAAGDGLPTAIDAPLLPESVAYVTAGWDAR